MRIHLITPAGASRLTGNQLSGARWVRILRDLGHRVSHTAVYQDTACDLLIALHARRSHDAVVKFSERYPERPLVVILTGTDLYRDIHVDRDARDSLDRATRLVVLQRMGLAELAPAARRKTAVIYQSAPPLIGSPGDPDKEFTVCVVGHLRPEKDPLRTAMASRSLPRTSKIKVLQIGRALVPSFGERARREEQRNARYRWLGELPHARTRRLLAQSHLLSLTSRMEGSSNALCEALASGVPVVASRISGLVGTLGSNYPGYFDLGDTASLTQLLNRAESDARFYRRLGAHCARRAYLVDPEREENAWRRLIEEITR